MDESVNLGPKLKLLREKLELSQDEFARVLGLGTKTYWNYEKGYRTIPSELVAKIVRVYRLNPSWLFGNSPNMLMDGNTINELSKNATLTATTNSADECIILERISLDANDRNKKIHSDDAGTTPVQLGKSLIKDIFKIKNVNNLKVCRAIGDSMEDTIFDNDDLLVDVGKKDFNNGGIFILTINNDWFIKRLHYKINGDLAIISDNSKKYQTEIIHPNDNININIIGRVIKNLSRGL